MACPEDSEKCKKSFKGVEGFLRRVAFNLGNSPSQTEVKIISCIPIDVTDLQQKIIHLERQLEEANSCRARSQTQCRVLVKPALVAGGCSPSPVCDAEPGPACTPLCGTVDTPVCAVTCTPVFEPACAAACNPPNLQDPGPCCSRTPYPEYCPRKRSTVSFNVPVFEPNCSRGQQREPLWSNANCNDCETRKRNIFKRNKKPRKHSPLVYFAHTTTSPFDNYKKEIAARRELKRMDATVTPPRESATARKQFSPETYLQEWTGSSQASAPVCRDRRAPRAAAGAAADACSCCRGRFYDLDLDYRPFRFIDDIPATNMYQNVDSGNVYYNSSYYDIFPVKEKPDTVKRENDTFKKWEPKIHFDEKYFQNDYRAKIECRPVLTSTKFSPAPRGEKHLPVKFPRRRENIPKRILYANSVDESSRNTFVECSDIYKKRTLAKKRKSKPSHRKILLKNVECLTHNVNDTECQTESSKNMRPEASVLTEEDRTESTLDQIKAILQSVLSHVKTNNQIKVQGDNKDKKDAVVQKELQSNSQPCSRLLNSFTYSPYSMDPYMASCSRAVPPGACAPVVMAPQAPAQSSHFKCMQNFPVFIQHSPTQKQCSGCYRPRPELNRHPIQTSTNTMLPAEEKRSKETENLIKEIYKSMALNIPIKRTSQSDYNDQKSANVTRIESGEPVISNVMMMSRRVGSQMQSDRARGRSVSTATTSRATSSTRAPRPRPRAALPQDSDEPSGEEAESASASASASDDTIVPSKQSAKEAEKRGIFKRLGSVFKRRRKVKQEDRASSAAESESDSDDYQTVYSQQTARSRPPPPPPERPRARRSPYLEQEHRRGWDEQLMYQTHSTKHSSEQAPSRPRSVRSRPPGIYFRKYEARHATVTPSPFNQTEPDSTEEQQAYQTPRPRKNVSLKVSNKRISWLKRHSPKVKCADQWKRLLLES